MKFLVAGAIALKGLGGILFILSSSFGAFLLVCSLTFLYEIEVGFSSAQFFQALVLFSLLQLLHQVITTPILYDFYNYHSEDKEFIQLFIKFTQVRTGFFPMLELGMIKLELLSQRFFTYCCNCLWNIVLLAEYGSLRGIVVFHWDEKLYSQKATQEEGCQNKNILVERTSRIVPGCSLYPFSISPGFWLWSLSGSERMYLLSDGLCIIYNYLYMYAIFLFA